MGREDRTYDGAGAGELVGREHVGRASDEVERGHGRAIEPVEVEDVLVLDGVNLDPPVGVERLLTRPLS